MPITITDELDCISQMEGWAGKMRTASGKLAEAQNLLTARMAGKTLSETEVTQASAKIQQLSMEVKVAESNHNIWKDLLAIFFNRRKVPQQILQMQA